jgi:hypothetical protein
MITDSHKGKKAPKPLLSQITMEDITSRFGGW